MDHGTVTAQIADLLLKHTDADGITPTPVSNLYLYRFSSQAPSDRGIPGPALCVVVQGAKEVVLGDRNILQQAGAYMLTPVDLPATGNVVESSRAKPFLGFRYDLDVGEIGGVALRFAGASTHDQRPEKQIAVTKWDPSLGDAFLRLAQLLDSPEDVPAIAPLLQQEILYRLFRCGHEFIFQEAARTGGRIHRLTRLINWMKSNCDRAVSGEQLATRANMSVSVLYESFKDVTGMSPLQFHKQLRLQEARRILITGDRNAASAAISVGYRSTSQFSRDYTRLFGRPPVRDLKLYKSSRAST